MTLRTAFLDRDGVITRAHYGPEGTRPARTFDELEVLPGVLGSIELLRAKGYAIVIVTNQPDVRRGIVTKEFAQEVNYRVARYVGADRWYACYHDERDACFCRKPAPGMIINGLNDLGHPLSGAVMIGDRVTDFTAGQRAGVARNFLLMTNDPVHLRRVVENQL